MAKQNTATKIMATVIGAPSLADKMRIEPVVYATREEFVDARAGIYTHAKDYASVVTASGNHFTAFEDGSVIVQIEWRKCIGAFRTIKGAIDFAGDDPRVSCADFGVVAA